MKRTSHIFFIVAGISILVLLLVAIVYQYAVEKKAEPANFVVTKTERGFVPSKIIINVGDTITFHSEEEEEYWPASDSHPTHLQYGKFDPKRALAPGETWSMTFDTPGVWGFHDHLDSQMKGQIIVRGGAGEAREQCLKKQKENDLAPACWELEVTDTLTRKGLGAAFTLVDSLYTKDPVFRRNCHDVMHIVGAAAFREFKNSPSVQAEQRTSYCGYGFYHGFIETMLLENGSSNFDSVKKYCAVLEKEVSPSASGPCFHGIGHAIFDSLPGSTWGSYEVMTKSALAVCERILDREEDRIQCASGVYNSIANALSSRNYNLSFSDIDSTAFCSAQKQAYQKSCFGEVVIGYIREEHMNREDALSFINKLKDPERLSQLFYYFSDETKRMMNELDVGSLASSCMALSESTQSRRCIEGVLQGFRESTQVGKTYEFALPFCGRLTDASQNMFCIREVIETTPQNILSTPPFFEACQKYARPEAVSVCENI